MSGRRLLPGASSSHRAFVGLGFVGLLRFVGRRVVATLARGGVFAVSGLAVSGLAVSGLAVSGLAVSGLAVSGLAVSGLAVSGCGGGSSEHVPIVTPTASPADEWPPLAQSPTDASTVEAVLASAEGAQVRVRAYLVAVTLPCPACNTTLGQGRSDPRPRDGAIGRARPPTATTGPGCAPCPTPAATFSDEAPTASAATQRPPLRAVGAAEGLQARHVGRLFLLTGIFHPKGALGAELEVTDIRALDGR